MGPQVPFWLQIVAVVLAPLLGFAGVGIGAGLKERSDRRLALRQDRRDVYTRFIRALNELDKMYAWDGTQALLVVAPDRTTRPSDPISVIRRYGTAIKEHALSVTGVAHEISLIGSTETDLAASYALSRAQQVAELVSPSRAPEMQEWNKRRQDFKTSIQFFRHAATRELFVNRRQSERLGGPELTRALEIICEESSVDSDRD